MRTHAKNLSILAAACFLVRVLPAFALPAWPTCIAWLIEKEKKRGEPGLPAPVPRDADINPCSVARESYSQKKEWGKQFPVSYFIFRPLSFYLAARFLACAVYYPIKASRPFR